MKDQRIPLESIDSQILSVKNLTLSHSVVLGRKNKKGERQDFKWSSPYKSEKKYNVPIDVKSIYLTTRQYFNMKINNKDSFITASFSLLEFEDLKFLLAKMTNDYIEHDIFVEKDGIVFLNKSCSDKMKWSIKALNVNLEVRFAIGINDEETFPAVVFSASGLEVILDTEMFCSLVSYIKKFDLYQAGMSILAIAGNERETYALKGRSCDAN